MNRAVLGFCVAAALMVLSFPTGWSMDATRTCVRFKPVNGTPNGGDTQLTDQCETWICEAAVVSGGISSDACAPILTYPSTTFLRVQPLQMPQGPWTLEVTAKDVSSGLNQGPLRWSQFGATYPEQMLPGDGNPDSGWDVFRINFRDAPLTTNGLIQLRVGDP